jgi:hypothetical protein
MRERVFSAMNEVWSQQCRESCRLEVEFGTSISLNAPQQRKIQICRVTSEPNKIVGVFHGRCVGPGDWELMKEEVWSPPTEVANLRAFYRKLLEGTFPDFTWVHIREEMEAIR